MPRFRKGFKLLNANAETRFWGKAFHYHTSPSGWSQETRHPDPCARSRIPNVQDVCGSGRLHVHKRFTTAHAPAPAVWYLARAEIKDLVKEDSGKFSTHALQLRRIPDWLLAMMLRFGWGAGQNLSYFYLHGADLEGANLGGANLYRANLTWADLTQANLGGANLYRANLAQANLGGANFAGATRYGAYLHEAYPHGDSFARATMPDGTEYTDLTDLSVFTKR